MSEKTTKLSALTPDRKNANKGTERGRQTLENSLRNYGAGRSILIDKHGTIIAGNKTAEEAAAIGLDDIIVVETDGTKLVAVKRTDLDLEHDPRARQLAYADNRISELDLSFDAEQIARDLNEGLDLSGLWTAGEIDGLMGGIPADEPEYDESVAESVKKVICPECGHEFAV